MAPAATTWARTKPVERGARGVRDNLEPHPSGRPAPDLDGGHDQRLVEELAAAAQPHLGPPDVALVHFDLGLQGLPVGANDGAAQLLDRSRCFLAGDPESALCLEAPHARRMCRDRVGGQNQSGSVSRVRCKTVPAVTEVCCPQALHCQRCRLVSSNTAACAHRGHRYPSGQRQAARYARHAASFRNRALKLGQIFGNSGRGMPTHC